jgi:thiamine-monophosphate kinase
VGGDTTSAPSHGSLTITALGTTRTRPLPRAAARPGWEVGVTGPLGGAGLHQARPWPLLERGAKLNAAGLCCGDVSDGLLRELDKFALAAGVGAIVHLDRVPCVEGVGPLQALASGEEVELVCAGPGPLPSGLRAVGALTADGTVRVLDAGTEIEVKERGYDHFA